MLALPVSAGSSGWIGDKKGDLNIIWNMKTGEPLLYFPDSVPMAKAGYVDIVAVRLTQEGSTYTFEMEVAKALPREGDALFKGALAVEWAMWIDPSPWNPVLSPVGPLFRVALAYSEGAYWPSVTDFSTGEMVDPLSSSHVGNTITIVFSAGSVGDQFSWWSPMTRVYFGPPWSSGQFFVDQIDYGTVDGQMYADLPWNST